MNREQRVLLLEESRRESLAVAHEYGCHVCSSILWEVVEQLDSIVLGNLAEEVSKVLIQIRGKYMRIINEQYLEAIRELAEKTDKRLRDD